MTHLRILTKSTFMKKLLIPVLLLLAVTGCEKNTPPVQTCTNREPAAESAQIVAYCNTNGLFATKDTSGIYYQVIDAGSDEVPTLNSKVSVTYVAKFLDGTVIDEAYATTPITNPLNILIRGWQIGLQLIGKGGHIKMVVPSALCYGCNGVPGVIPPNSIIYFDIQLEDVL